jgi:glutaredoxin
LVDIIQKTWYAVGDENPPFFMDITIYTTTGCGYCVKIKELMSRAGIKDYTEVRIPRDMLKEDFKIKYPFASGFPYVIIDGEEVGGLVPTVKYFVDKGLVSSKKHE